MSTNARIGILNKDKSTDSIYLHWDGYPSHVTPILLRSYNTPEKIRELISFGDISILGDNVTKPDKSKPHSFNNPQPNTVVAYHRDRQEPWYDTKPLHTENKKKLLEPTYVPYIYLFDESKNIWTYTHGTRFRSFSTPIGE